MLRLDLLASEPQYHAHLDPVWEALPEDVRGQQLDRRSRTKEHAGAVLVASGTDLRAARKHYQRIAMLEHGIGQGYLGLRSASYPGTPGREAIGLFLAPNASASSRDQEVYPNARHVIVGDPVLDTLPKREGSGRVVCMSFHWDWPNIPEMRSALPHYRDALPEIAQKFTLIGHAHPRIARQMRNFYRKAGIEFVPDLSEVCRRADMYACDNSSTLYEFASTGRPVVVLNAPWYRREVEHGLRYWAASRVGINVDGPEELPDAITRALDDPPEVRADREAALDIAYAYRSGAGKRAADVLVEWLA